VSLLTSLVAHWPLDEASGTRYDAHASYDLGEVSGVGRVAGKIGYAAEFPDGETGYLRLSGIDGTDLGLGDTDFTLALWARIGARGGLLLQWVDSSFYLYTATGGALVVGCGGDEYSGATFPLNEWKLVILDFRASDNRLRLHQDSTSTWTVTAPDTGTEVVLGDNVGTTGDRWLDSVSVWLRVLTDAERTTLYNFGSGLDYPDFDLPVLLAGTVAGAATLTGGLSVTRALAGTVAGAATLTGGLSVTRALAGTVAGAATLTGGAVRDASAGWHRGRGGDVDRWALRDASAGWHRGRGGDVDRRAVRHASDGWHRGRGGDVDRWAVRDASAGWHRGRGGDLDRWAVRHASDGWHRGRGGDLDRWAVRHASAGWHRGWGRGSQRRSLGRGDPRR
jgi:hypothetical protein